MFSKSYLIPVSISVLILFAVNTLMVSSMSPTTVFKQVFSWILGVMLFFIGTQINPKNVVGAKNTIFIICCGLLILPILLNNITRGSRRWINVGPTTIQPSEITKPWFMLYLANTNFPLFYIVPLLIVLYQPDLGSAMTLGVLAIPVLIFQKKYYKFYAIGLVIFVLLSPLIWRFGLHDYQRHRVEVFLNPKSDPLNKGYNVIQSQIAIGSGGFFGKGYRQGTQGQLLFLPEKHTDFMFASTAEELGVVGIGLVLGSYFVLIYSLIRKAYTIDFNRPLFIFTLGIAFQIWFQVLVNSGMNIGLLPVTGIPLPFMSVGGSSIMASLLSLGVVFSQEEST